MTGSVNQRTFIYLFMGSESQKLTIADYRAALDRVLRQAELRGSLPPGLLSSINLSLAKLEPARLIEPVQVINLAAKNPALEEEKIQFVVQELNQDGNPIKAIHRAFWGW